MTREDLREAVARAIWDKWRMSEVAPLHYRNFTWDDLRQYAADKHGPCMMLIELGLQEADAALSVIGKACAEVANDLEQDDAYALGDGPTIADAILNLTRANADG